MIDPIINAQWLADNYEDVVVCDVRSYLDGRDGQEAYQESHLPGAVFVDMKTVLASDPGPVVGRHPLPTPEAFATGLAAAGVTNAATVVVYDDLGGMVAGRLVWMLRVIGQEAALLDGGLQAWTGEYAQGQGPQLSPTARSRWPVPWPDDALVDADELEAHIASGGVVADSRSPERFRGETEPVDQSAGHIPGAISLPFSENLDADNTFIDRADLQARFKAANINSEAIIYCGSGVSACNNLLAMEAVGLGRARLYVGSWSGWSSDPDRPVATGPS